MIFQIFGPQIILLFTAVLLALMIKVSSGRPRGTFVMICFTALVVATLVQLREYTVFFDGGGHRGSVPTWLILDPMGWTLTLSLLLIATASVLMRRLRRYAGHGDGTFCLLITLSTIGWSLMPAAASLPMVAACMLMGSLPLGILSTFGFDDGYLMPLANKTLWVSLGAMLLALVLMVHGGAGSDLRKGLIPDGHATALMGWAVLTVIFLMPILFWTGSVPLIWWFGDAAADVPAEVVFFLLLVPYIGSMGGLLRLLHSLARSDPTAAGGVSLVMVIVGTMGVAAYGVKALTERNIADIVGNMVGVLAATTLVTLSASSELHQNSFSHLGGCVVLYALTAGFASGVALGLLGGEKKQFITQLPQFAREKFPRTLVLILALLSLGGLPPTMGCIARMDLFAVMAPFSTPQALVVLAVNVLSVIFGGMAALRVAAYAFTDTAEIPVDLSVAPKRRKVRRLAIGTLLLLLAASVVNGAALVAYNPLQQIAFAFKPGPLQRSLPVK